MIRLAIGSLYDVCSEREGLRAVIESWIKSKGRPAKAAELKKLYDRCFRLGYGAQLVREELGEFFDRIDW
jgi:hypothetical protein